MEQSGTGPGGERIRNSREAMDADMAQWRKQFDPKPLTGLDTLSQQQEQAIMGSPMAPPLGMLAKGPTEMPQPDDVLKQYAAATSPLLSPTSASPLSIPLRSTAPIPATEISAFLPPSLASTSVPWKQGAKPAYMSSVFGGASRWTS